METILADGFAAVWLTHSDNMPIARARALALETWAIFLQTEVLSMGRVAEELDRLLAREGATVELKEQLIVLWNRYCMAQYAMSGGKPMGGTTLH